jgi:hypothetical protein
MIALAPLLLAVAASPSLRAVEPLQLSIHLKEGQEYVYKIHESWQFEKRKDQITDQRLKVKVSKASDEGFTAYCSIESADTDDEDFVQEFIAGFVGCWFKIDYLRDGRVKELSDDSLLETERTRHSRMSQYGFMGLALPTGPVKPGDTWTASFDMKRPYDLNDMKVTFKPTSTVTRTFKFIETSMVDGKKVAKIEATSKSEYQVNGTSHSMNFENNWKGDEQATYTVDVETGLPIAITESSKYSSDDKFGDHVSKRKGGATAEIKLIRTKNRS